MNNDLEFEKIVGSFQTIYRRDNRITFRILYHEKNSQLTHEDQFANKNNAAINDLPKFFRQ